MDQKTDTGAVSAPVVNEKQSGKGLKIVTVIACVLAICGIGFGIYGMVRTPQKDDPVADVDTPKKEDETGLYESFLNNLSKNNLSVFGYYYHYDGSTNVLHTVLAEIKDYHLKIIDLSDNSKVIVEADNIVSAYFVKVGNGDVPYMNLIKKNGGVARVDISEIGNREIEDLEGYSNIVSIYGGSDLLAHLIDIDGNMYTNY